MMDSSDSRPHHRTTTTTATTTTTPSLFICFTSRPSSASSSSSMKIPSKSSILSPGRARDTPTSLSTSLSRRLKANGSLKGAQSPMFPTGGKRRGFENPEPSSPKVTCIGQVRVKTKKQGNKIRTLSRRRSGDFRRGTVRDNNNFALTSGVNQLQQQENMPIHQRNQRWVHLPLTICEALRKGFGAEFNCLFPCRAPSCLRGGGGKEEREMGRRKGSGGEAVFGRWLVAVNEGRGDVGGEGREVELVVGGEEVVEERREIRERISLRRHVDEEEEEEVGFEEDEKCEEGGRLTICVPPKNALLLMRSRSDPVRVSALASRFWESPSADKCAEEAEESDDEIVEKCDEGVINGVLGLVEGQADKEREKLGLIEVSNEEEEEEEKPETEVGLMEVEEGEGEENPEEGKLEIDEELCQEADEEENQELEMKISLSEVAVTDPEKLELTEDVLLIQEGDEEDAQVEERRESDSSSVVSVHLFSDDEVEAEEELAAEETALEKGEEENEQEEIETQNSPWKVEAEGEERVIQERSESEKTLEEEAVIESEKEREEKQRESNISPLLPDCLLLMRYEPKLSMEVSKETWVCTTDFIRWLPERQPKQTDGGDEPMKKKTVSTDSNPVHYQPPRSSCSLPAAVASRVSTAARIEQRLVNAVAYEPLVLTRCKSEPMRTAAAKLKPESCFWKNRKLEPHRRATVGFGAAGVGF